MIRMAQVVAVFAFSLTAWSAGKATSAPYLSLQERLKGKELSPQQASAMLKHIKEEFSPQKVSSKNLTEEELTQSDKVALCNNDEEIYLGIENQVLSPLFEKLAAGKIAATSSYFAKTANIQGSLFGPSSNEGGYPAYAWKPDGVQKGHSLAGILSGFGKINDASFETVQYLFVGHRSADRATQDIQLKVEMRVLGADLKGKPTQATGHVEFLVSRSSQGFKISSFRPLNGLTVTLPARSPAFLKLSNAKLFGSELKADIRREAVRRGGYALAVDDFTADGKPDILMGRVGQMQLFKNRGSKFDAVQTGAPQESLVKSAAFFDYDNDGDQDLLVVRFIPDNEKTKLAGLTATTVYRNDGKGNFEKIPDSIKSYNERLARAMPAALADFDNDGFLDIYVGYPGAMDFTHPVVDKDTQSHGLYFGNGSSFEPLDRKKFTQTFTTFNRSFPHSALAVDYNMDSLVDLLVIDDRGGLSAAFTNKGNRYFSQEAEEIGIGNHGYGMAIAANDFNNDGFIDLVLTNVETAASERISKSCYQNWEYFWNVRLDKSLRIFLGSSRGFQEINAENIGLGSPGFGLSGVRFIDFDNDGLQDLYVTNGVWSGTERSQRLDSYFVRSYKISGVGDQAQLERSLQNRTQSVFMDILSYFKGDLFSTKSGSGARPSLAGFQRNRLYKNLGDNKFIEVGYLEGVDSIADGYMVASADMNGDGKPDLVLRNADPGSQEVHFSPLEIYENQIDSKNNWLSLRLVGTKSNADAVGALVTVETQGQKQIQPLIGLEGTVQSSKVLHFGLGKFTKAKSVVVTWPSGARSEISNLSAGRHTLVEPK